MEQSPTPLPPWIFTLDSLNLPAGVAYDAALLDDFFRGNIELTLPARGVYTLTDSPAGFNEMRLTTRNNTDPGMFQEDRRTV